MAKKNVLTQGKKARGDEAARAGRLEDARAAFESVCKLDPLDVEAWVKVSLVHKRQGNFQAAESCAARAVKLQPQIGFAHFALGTALQSQGRVREAIASYRRAIVVQPEFPDNHYLLGNALHDVGEVAEALACYRRALQLRPEFVEALGDLGGLLMDLGQLAEAETVLQRALALQPANVVALTNRGHLLRLQDRVDEAIDMFRHALRLAPDAVALIAGLAGLLERTSRLDEAADWVQRGLTIAPDDPALGLIAAQLERRNQKLYEAADRLERLKQTRLTPVENADVNLLLGQIYDQAGDTARALPLIIEAKKLKAELGGIGGDGCGAYLERVARVSALATPALAEAQTSARNSRDPVFLIGFPRSGTTLLEQILDAHPALQAMEERDAAATMVNRCLEFVTDDGPDLECLLPQQLDTLRNVYFDEVHRHVDLRPGAILLDKMPLNTVGVPVIWRVFSKAKFILAIRHPCDVCLSCLMQNFAVNEAMASFFSLEDTVRTYVAVMNAWKRYSELLPLDFHVVRYEDLVGDVEGEARRLTRFLDLEWNDAMLDHVGHALRRGAINTPSYHQVTQPIYQSAKYRWRRYAHAFDPVMPLLQPFIDEFGYSNV
jgi:tetratricopeptide (TPR) repeat protein